MIDLKDNTFQTMRNWIKSRATHIRVQTELGSAVKITKTEAYKLLDTLERRNIKPRFECTEIRPMKYLVTIRAGSGGIYCDK